MRYLKIRFQSPEMACNFVFFLIFLFVCFVDYPFSNYFYKFYNYEIHWTSGGQEVEQKNKNKTEAPHFFF